VNGLHVLHSMNCGGAETLIMNVYKNIDRSKVQFDFLVNCFDEMYFEKEIEELGGRIFRMKFLTQLTPPVYQHKLCRFFRNTKNIKSFIPTLKQQPELFWIVQKEPVFCKNCSQP